MSFDKITSKQNSSLYQKIKFSKIKTIKEIEKISEILKKKGKKIVTTNGVFDLIHVGHLRYLKKAKSLGDILIIGVNADKSVKNNKGNKRPVVSLNDRMELLSSMEVVDFVFPFSSKTPIKWLEKIKPDFHVKGGDYKLPLPEQDIVEKNNGKIVLIKEVEGKSTTNLIEKIKLIYC